MFKAYKYRIYSNKAQEELIQKTFGCCRFVYNKTLAYRKELYEKEKKNMRKFDCANYVSRILKSEYAWLKEVDKFALSNSAYNMDYAYKIFLNGKAEYPKFKRKSNKRKTYKTNCNHLKKTTANY